MSRHPKEAIAIAAKTTYAVVVGVWTPTGPWYEWNNLLTYKHAANYAAKVIRDEENPQLITIFDAALDVVYRHVSNRVTYDADLHEPAHMYIAQAMVNAIAKRYPPEGQ